jgi:hypothetical protein
MEKLLGALWAFSATVNGIGVAVAWKTGTPLSDLSLGGVLICLFVLLIYSIAEMRR